MRVLLYVGYAILVMSTLLYIYGSYIGFALVSDSQFKKTLKAHLLKRRIPREAVAKQILIPEHKEHTPFRLFALIDSTMLKEKERAAGGFRRFLTRGLRARTQGQLNADCSVHWVTT